MVRGGRGRGVVKGGFWGCAVLRGDYTMCAWDAGKVGWNTEMVQRSAGNDI
jgi:hypothetical protein